MPVAAAIMLDPACPISAQGKAAAQAEGTANARANTCVAYVTSSRTAGTVRAAKPLVKSEAFTSGGDLR